MGSGRGWKKKLFGHSTGWQSSCKRGATGAHLGTVSQTFRSWCLFMSLGIIVYSGEPNEGEAWALTPLTPSSIEWLISGSILSSSVPINPAHDKILDTWFLFSQSGSVCFQTPLVLVSSLFISTRNHLWSLHHCTDVKYFCVSGMTQVCTAIAGSSSISSPL